MGVLKSLGQADFKTVPGFAFWAIFEGDIEGFTPLKVMLATTVYWRSNTDNKERKVIGWHDGTNWLIVRLKDYICVLSL